MLTTRLKPAFTLAVLFVLAGAAQFFHTARAADAKDEQPNTLTKEEKEAGWQLLFDGKTTKGWRQYRGKEVPDKWQVVEGALVFDPKSGKNGGDIVTEKKFANFELVLEWKISEGGNSGLMYRVSEKFGAPYESGPEYQLLDNAKHSDGKNRLTSAASCYALYAPAKDMTKPVGEWNKTRLVVNGNQVEHWLNGKKVVEYELGSADWKKRVADSKFKDLPKFGKEPKGHIDLQDHGNRVEFRNIKIRVLKEKE
jgi:hypothetical protein